jgi:hypothetical protein
MVVGRATLLHLEHPLVRVRNVSNVKPAPHSLHILGDLTRIESLSVRVRKRHHDALTSARLAGEMIPNKICVGDDDDPHPPEASSSGEKIVCGGDGWRGKGEVGEGACVTCL